MESDGNETLNGATQTWCRKNAGRGRYRMGELRKSAGSRQAQEQETMAGRRRRYRGNGQGEAE
jgi:hypothetical protein